MADKEAAASFAIGMLGAEPDCSPVDLMEISVRLAKGMLLHYQREISTAAMANPIDLARLELLRPQFEQAIQRSALIAKAAMDSGVAERRQALAERAGGLISAVFMDAIQAGYGDVNTPERQLKAAEAIGRGLLALEQGEAIESTAREIAA